MRPSYRGGKVGERSEHAGSADAAAAAEDLLNYERLLEHF